MRKRWVSWNRIYNALDSCPERSFFAYNCFVKKIDFPFIIFVTVGAMILIAGFVVPQATLDKYEVEILLFVVLPYLSFYAWHTVIKDEIKKSSRK